jgi:hypothetical protein
MSHHQDVKPRWQRAITANSALSFMSASMYMLVREPSYIATKQLPTQTTLEGKTCQITTTTNRNGSK